MSMKGLIDKEIETRDFQKLMENPEEFTKEIGIKDIWFRVQLIKKWGLRLYYIPISRYRVEISTKYEVDGNFKVKKKYKDFKFNTALITFNALVSDLKKEQERRK